jgi:hypothetical protein
MDHPVKSAGQGMFHAEQCRQGFAVAPRLESECAKHTWAPSAAAARLEKRALNASLLPFTALCWLLLAACSTFTQASRTAIAGEDPDTSEVHMDVLMKQRRTCSAPLEKNRLAMVPDWRSILGVGPGPRTHRPTEHCYLMVDARCLASAYEGGHANRNGGADCAGCLP